MILENRPINGMSYLAPSSFPISPMLAEGFAAFTFGRSS